MSSRRRHRRALVATLVFVVVMAIIILHEVLWTVFFAITVAYVLYPLRRWLGKRGLTPRLASGVAALSSLVAVVVLFSPIVITIYQRRSALVSLLRDIPETVPVALLGFEYVIDVPALRPPIQDAVTTAAVELARSAPVLGAKLFLFAFIVYGLLVHPTEASHAARALVPARYHALMFAVHRRVRDTLLALYVLQAATAVATFAIALVLFLLLGYQSPFVLAVISGILQFIPILGPSLLIVGLAGFDLAFGDPTRAILVLVLGLLAVGFLPDAVLRPRLAARTARIPASVYFIGFTGGLLSVGLVGIVAGPLIVAVLVEVVGLLSTE